MLGGPKLGTGSTAAGGYFESDGSALGGGTGRVIGVTGGTEGAAGGGTALGRKLGTSMFGGGSEPPAGRTPSWPAITGFVSRGFAALAGWTPVGVYPGGGGR